MGWFEPTTWGNTDYLTLEICRIVLCIQIVAVAVELPRKYMKKHWVSVAIFLFPVMTIGWLVVGLFIWCLIPHFNFSSALLVSACVTATDPVLAAAVVGKGKFAERVPGHLRNLLSAESGCNDGMAFPFIYLSLNLVLHPGNARLIVKDWFLLTILWECVFGCILGATIGFVMKHAVAFAEKKGLIDRESFLAIFIFIAFNSAGLGSMLGVDDLLVSFAAGTAFGWNGAFAKKTEESHVSTVIDLIINLAFFVYFGAIIPWPQFNNAELGLNCWRLIILAIVIIFLRRLPAVVALKPFTPDVKTWREAFFCGHFGPIGVGAIFAAILARKDLESHYTEEETPLSHVPTHDFPHTQLIATIWPIVCFVVIVSIIVHGSSVAVLTLGKRLNRMAITMSFTTTNTQDQGPSWMSRLQKLDKSSSSYSLQRVDTEAPKTDEEGHKLPKSNTVETSGIKVRPAGGAKRRKHKKKRRSSRIKKSLSRINSNEQDQLNISPTTERQRPQAEFLQLGRTPSRVTKDDDENDSPSTKVAGNTMNNMNKEESTTSDSSSQSIEVNKDEKNHKIELLLPQKDEPSVAKPDQQKAELGVRSTDDSAATTAYQEGGKIIIEDQDGEIIETVSMKENEQSKNVGDKNFINNSEASRRTDPYAPQTPSEDDDDSDVTDDSEDMSIHSMNSLRHHMSQYSGFSVESSDSNKSHLDPKNGRPKTNRNKDSYSLDKKLSRTLSQNKTAFYKKSDPKRRKVYAHQVDDLIVIENEDGEIIRRYKVNRHSAQNVDKSRSRSGTLVGKALSLVGIKGKDSVNATTNTTGGVQNQSIPTFNITGNDLEKQDDNLLIPEHDSKNPNSPLKDSRMESKIETKLTDILKKNGNKTINQSGRPVIPESRHVEEEDEEEENSSESEDSEIDDDELGEGVLQETEVERKRRLAALGHLPSFRRDANDEEE